MQNEKWYHPSKHTGWDKDDNQETRRAKMLKAHKDDSLAAGRAMQALANVTQDRETANKARSDALYFYRLHKQSNDMRERRAMRLSARFKRLPRY